MAVTPDTTIHLLKVPLELDNTNQLTFATATAQYNYFISCPKKTEEDLFYQRKDNYIAFPDHIDNIITYNYVMYQNSNYSNKWFYAYITKMEYENDGMTRVYIETDVFQTWQFDIVYKASFVEREHVNDDTKGLHTIDEGLALGDFICNKKDSLFHTSVDTLSSNTDLAIIVGVSEYKENGSYQAKGGSLTNGIYTGLQYFAFNTDANDLTYGIPALNNWIHDYAENQKADAIYCIFMYPSKFVTSALSRADHFVVGSNTTNAMYINHGTSVGPANKQMTLTQTTLDGYTPKNNKALCWPYNYLLVSNNNGGNVIYKLEDFYTISNNVKTYVEPKFIINNCLTPGGSIRLTPENYKGLSKNQIEGLNGGKYPVCNWLTDVYTNWLTQNGVNIAIDIIGGALSIGSQAIESGDANASGALRIGSTLAEVYKQSFVPDQARGNINCGDVVTAEGSNDFIFYNMSIKAETAKLIDDYFTMYGYKVNTLKLPNVTGRTYWNYVKTINCNLEGAIPQDDMQKLKSMFDTGVTFWHDSSKFLDYTQSNTIVT